MTREHCKQDHESGKNCDDTDERVNNCVDGVTPAIILGIITVPVLAITIFARYSRRLAGPWRWIYVIGTVITLYFNLFVLVVQLFEKVPALHAMAPTQTESPFKLTQLTVLIVSTVLAIVAVIRFRPEPTVLRSD